jgi:hypothetical protein
VFVCGVVLDRAFLPNSPKENVNRHPYVHYPIPNNTPLFRKPIPLYPPGKATYPRPKRKKKKEKDTHRRGRQNINLKPSRVTK